MGVSGRGSAERNTSLVVRIHPLPYCKIYKINIKELIAMRTKLAIMNRIALLKSRQPAKENNSIVKKLERQLRKMK
jgi:hypothetical protein